jgi:hypothetical protein
MGGYPDSRLKICLFSYMYNVFLCRCITKGGCCTALTGVDCRRAGHDLLAGPARSNCIPSIPSLMRRGSCPLRTTD